MDFPILENGERIGTLAVCREGLYTRFEAAIPARPGLQRLWLCGERSAACLGLLVPEGERLSLRRRLSRAELRSLPAPLRYAALAEPKPEARPPLPAEGDGRGFRRIRLFGAVYVVSGAQAGS